MDEKNPAVEDAIAEDTSPAGTETTKAAQTTPLAKEAVTPDDANRTHDDTSASKGTVPVADEVGKEAAPPAAVCPLCGIDVSPEALTCPRCKSRMDAHPRVPFALADTFDAWDALGDSQATASMALPFHTGIHTGPLPQHDFAETSPVAIEQPPAPPETYYEVEPMATEVIDPIAAAQPRASSEAGAAAEPYEHARPSTATKPGNPAETAEAASSDLAHGAFVPLEPKRTGRHIAGAIAAIVLMLAFLAGGAHLAAQANTLNQIDDARIIADICADAIFEQGSASDAFVDALPYQIDSVRLAGKETVEDGVDAHATVGTSNGFFSETRTVVVHYRRNAQTEDASEDGWVHECAIEDSEVRPTRGISRDDEQGIEDVDPALESGGTTCAVQVSYEADGAMWYARATGTRTLSYQFSDNAWTRTGIDEELGASSYQDLIGVYRQASSRATQRSDDFWGWGDFDNWQESPSKRSSGQTSELEITWVDDAAGSFGGYLSWRAPGGLLSSAKEQTFAFSGWIDEDGTLVVECNEESGSIEFVATAAGDGILELDGTAYTEARKLFGGTGVEGSSVSLVFKKQAA